MSAGRGTVIAGGGTGGHVVPSLQVARAMVARGHDPSTVELYGSRRGHEASLWPTLEFPYTLLPGRGIRRSVKPGALVANVGAVLGLIWACVHAFGSFARRRPRVVVIVGGYASFPAGVAAVLTRVPVVSVNTDAVPGAVNGLLGRFAAANAVAFEGTEMPRAFVTGTPVRPELAGLDRSAEGRHAGRAALGLPPDRQTTTAMGGSLGARRVNRAVAEVAQSWADDSGRSLYHVTGRRDYGQFAGGPDEIEGPKVRAMGSGTGSFPSRTTWPSCTPRPTCASPVPARCRWPSCSITGVPAILVPLPGAPRDHQTRNAEALVALGAAVHVPDPECDGARLRKELEALLEDPERLQAMGEAARRHAYPDAAARIAELVDANAR